LKTETPFLYHLCETSDFQGILLLCSFSELNIAPSLVNAEREIAASLSLLAMTFLLLHVYAGKQDKKYGVLQPPNSRC